MKKVLISLAIMSIFALSVKAQTSTNDNSNAPEISFEKLVHNYGTIHQNDDGNCEFKFKNKGKEPLILKNVASSCGCTVPRWPREPILPGQSASIKVKYDTKRLGTINKSITVISNSVKSTVVLSIKGKIIQKPKENAPLKGNNSAPVNK